MPDSNPIDRPPSEMSALVSATDWSRTSLGPREHWPQSLRVAVGICLSSRFPMFVWWGPELVNIYNDAYIAMLGKRHPQALGRPARETWDDIWEVVGPQAEAVVTRGEATWNERVLLVMERNGYPEETYFTWSYSPIPDDDGGIGGVFCAVTEDTPRLLAERERDRLLAQVETERARMGQALEQSPAFVAVLRGADHVFELVNEQYSVLIGRRDVLGKPAREALPEVVEQGFIDVLDRVYATGEPFVGKGVRILFQRQPDGAPEAAFLDFVYQPMRGRDGTVDGIMVHGVDITDRKRVEDALAWEKSVLELIATGSPLPEVLDAIVRSIEAQSNDGVLAAVAMLDVTGERLLHASAPSLPEAYNQAVHGAMIGPCAGVCGAALIEQRQVIAADLATDERWEVFRSLSAEHGLRACCSTPIFGPGGRVVGTVSMFYRYPHEPREHDLELTRSATHLAGIVIEKHRVDSRLQQSLDAERDARSEAERASRMKDEFLATLSHELRTPLNAILGWSRLIARDTTAPTVLAQGMTVIQRNAAAQARIIEDLLDMSAIISGKVRLDVQRVDLAEIVRSAVDTARPTAEAKRIRIHSVIDPLGAVVVRGDSSRLQQILWNLLSNAIKFTPRDGRVEVLLERVCSHVEIRVSDSGEGIHPEFLPYVFDRFRQADASTTRVHGGLGLGLSIVKQLVELHGGAIRAQSAGMGHGAKFVVELPLTAIWQAPGVTSERPHPRVASESIDVEDARAELASMRVLVVDDDADSREVVTRLLEDGRAVVTTAGSADEAMAQLAQQRFHVLVTDIGMPGQDGYALLRRVRSLGADRGGDVPALALTAYARAEDRVKAIRAGFQMHVAKPVEPAELIAMVASLGARHQPG